MSGVVLLVCVCHFSANLGRVVLDLVGAARAIAERRREAAHAAREAEHRALVREAALRRLQSLVEVAHVAQDRRAR